MFYFHYLPKLYFSFEAVNSQASVPHVYILWKMFIIRREKKKSSHKLLHPTVIYT